MDELRGDAGRRAQDESAGREVLLERETELAALDAALAAGRDGAGQLTVVEGPAGTGKSSMLSAARARAAAAGITVLRARGSEMESAFSYGTVRQLFERVLTPADESWHGGAFDGAAAHAAPLFDVGATVERSSTGDEVDFALVHGLYWLTVNLAEPHPLLLAIDDLQWADGASLRWFSYLVRRLEGLPVCALAAVRTGEVENHLLGDLLADPSTNVVRPTALSVDAVAELVRIGLADSDDEFCRACHDATGGNPLLVRELLRTLASEKIEPTAGSVEAVGQLAPDTVARSVRARLSRLPSESVAVAHAIAVLGDDVDGKHVAALADLDPRTLAYAASALTRLELLVPEASFQFAHPMVRNAVYSNIPVYQRPLEHARAAQVLAFAGAPIQQIADQLLHAPPGTTDQAAEALRDAASDASDRGAPESAIRYLRRALEERLDDGVRGELLLELGANDLRLGKTAAVERLREALPRLRDKQRRSQASLEQARALMWSTGDDAARVLEQALAEDCEDDDIRRLIEAELIATAFLSPSRQADARRRIEAVPFDAVEDVGAHMLLGLRAFHEATLGRNRERVAAHADRALTAMARQSARTTHSLTSYLPLYADQLEPGIRHIEAELLDARNRGAIFRYTTWMVLRGVYRYAAGALDEAEADLRGALDALADRSTLFVPQAYGALAQVLVERGALDEADERLDTAEAALGPIQERRMMHASLFRARGMVAQARGDHHTALQQASATGEILAALGTVNPAISYPGWRSEAARAHHALGARAEAVELVTEEVELTRAWGAPRPLGRALRTLGTIEGGNLGTAHLREAVDILETSPARLEYAYALADLGSALRRSNQRTAAREPLRKALDLAQSRGANLLADHAQKELLATGARPRRLQLSGAQALTPSERRVATMAADGLSNRKIAQSLFVTLRTVEMHLSSTFRKLDISSRTQLAARLGDRSG